MITVHAPGRAELLGNHTDYNEGLVLSFAVERGVTLRGQTRTDDRVILHAKELGDRYEGTLCSLAPSEEKPWANYALGVVAQFQKRGLPVRGFEAEITSDLPMGAGLSSSAALETATAFLLQEFAGLKLDKLEIAKIGQAAEHAYVGVKCGLLDQISSVFGRTGHLTFIDCRTFTVQNVPVPSSARFLIANSGVKHALVAGEYNERRESCEAAAQALGVKALRDVRMLTDLESRAASVPAVPLKRARHVVGENERVRLAVAGLERGDLQELGKWMFVSHQSSQENFENSCPELDALVAAAREVPGCLGARLSGGGFGGATINLVKAGREQALIDALTERCPGASCLLTQAADGARVL